MPKKIEDLVIRDDEQDYLICSLDSDGDIVMTLQSDFVPVTGDVPIVLSKDDGIALMEWLSRATA